MSAETRDLGKLTLEVGAITEIVSVTSEVTPVQMADSSRRATITVDDIANIQMKGRDMFGLLAILPGVQDTNLNRDFAQWRSAISITINGMPSQSKDVRVDGINIVDEGGCGTAFVNLNMDAIGEVQVISNGYTAENGRNNGGLISIVTKSGTSTFKGSAWYNGRRDRFNANDYFREVDEPAEAALSSQHLGLQRGRARRDPGLDRQPHGEGREQEVLFLRLAGVHRRRTADGRSPAPTCRPRSRRPGTFRRRGSRTGRSSRSSTRRTGVAFPGNVIPADRINPLGQTMLNLLPTANGILNPQAGQEWTSNSAYDLTPVHGRTNHVLRMDAVLTDKTRVSFKILKDRDDDWQRNCFTPGTGFVNQNTPGLLMSSTVTQVLRPTVVNEMNFGYTHNRWGFKAADDFDYTSLYRSTLGIDPPRFEPFGAYTDPPQLSGFGGAQVDEWPYAPRFATSGGNRAGLAGYMTERRLPLPRLNLSGRFVVQRRPVDHEGPPQLQDGPLPRVQPQDRTGLGRLHGQLQFRPQRQQPAQHGQRLRQHAARQLHHLHRADEPRRQGRPALAERLLHPGQLAHHPAA